MKLEEEAMRLNDMQENERLHRMLEVNGINVY
jgi:hypothetical protein